MNAVIAVQCICGQSYEVDESDVGRRATCSHCLNRFVVPDSADDVEFEVRLPPRAKRRKKPDARPEVRDVEPAGFEPAFRTDQEMHPVLVISIAVLLFLNGWAALGWSKFLVFLSVVGVNLFADPDPDIHRTMAMMAFLAVGQAGVAASLAGVLMWRGYAVKFLIGFTVLQSIIDWCLLWDFLSLATLNVVGIATIILMLRHLSPVAWKRLMSAE